MNKISLVTTNQRNYLLVIFIYLVLAGCADSGKSFMPASPEDIVKQRAYRGSIYKELKAAVWETPYTELPTYKLDKGRINSGEFEKNSARTIDTHFDLMETDQVKIVHPNGVCVTGRWSISQENQANRYSGYFSNGSQGLILARFSSEGDLVSIPDNEKQISGHISGKKYISYGLVGKLFPTNDPSDTKLYKPAHFVVQTDIGGQTSSDLSEVEMMNAPDVTAVRRGLVDGGFIGGGVRILARTGKAFDTVDESNSIRQTYEVAELGKLVQTPTNTPKYLNLTASPRHRKQLAKGDFRIAIKDYIEKRGEISFDILVANQGRKDTKTTLIQKTIVAEPWVKIGELRFEDAVTSRVCDAQLHFHHPAWRQNRNDPDSRVRPELPMG